MNPEEPGPADGTSPAREPVFNVPVSVVGVLGVLIGVHVLRQLLSPERDIELLVHLAFIPARYGGSLTDVPGGTPAAICSFITHMALHGGIAHLAINCAALLAFGGAVAKRVGGWRFLALFLVTGALGAAFYLVFHWGDQTILVGASGGVSGLFGAMMRFLFAHLRRSDRTSDASNPVAATSLQALLRDPQSLIAIVVWLGSNALFGLLGDPLGGGMPIAWEAHVGGFLAGLLGFGLVDRRLVPEGSHRTS